VGRAGFDTRDFYGEEGQRAILECSGAAERAFFRALAEGRKPPVKLVVGFVALLSVGRSRDSCSHCAVCPRSRGTMWALMALGIVGFAFWKVVQFLERDAAKTDAEAQKEKSDESDRTG
jgi:hypothetical protein